MTTESNDSSSAPHSAPMSVGRLLADTREQAGLTQEQVAGDLYMTVTKVKSLESDEFDRLHSDTFIRGYLRAYANLLKLDVERVLSLYDAQARQLGLVAAPVIPESPDNGGKKIWQFVGLVLAALLILWLISVWFFDNKKEPSYEMPSTLVLPQQESLPVAAPASSSASSTTSVVVGEPANVSEDSIEAALGSASGDGVAASSAASSLRKFGAGNLNQVDELKLVFTQECWLEVSDAQGDVLAAELEPAGSQRLITGKAPFDVKLGNAPGTHVFLNGEAVAITPLPNSKVLNLKVGP